MTKTAQINAIAIINVINAACAGRPLRGAQNRAAVAALLSALKAADTLAFVFEYAADNAADDFDALMGERLRCEYGDLADMLARLAADVSAKC